ncbi:MAG TPA: DUF1345 domain-containing protein [Streptosporangiaceae bacterium]|jgi:uncharacterized membrane protein|nr:DUF1345 domain-containing protein [Streptosporangiaceae bacterium]
MRPEAADHPRVPRVSTARTKLLVSLAAAIAGGTSAAVAGTGRAAPLIGWDILALVFCAWVWSTVWTLDAESTSRHARREDPSSGLADVVLLGAAIASLVAVGVVLAGAGHASGALQYLQAGLALMSVFVSWTLIHTVFTLKYARLYYAGQAGGINFNQADAPGYGDFAYLSFTIGMTFQVSDTNIKSKQIRRTALRHAWLSFPMGAVIIATTINVVAGLAK